MGRLIDANLTLIQAWQNFFKQEEEHEKNIDDYDILRDQFYEQSGFECCQQAIEDAPTVEAIPKADYEARLKADMVAMLEEISLEIDEMDCTIDHDFEGYYTGHVDCQKLIREKINALKENTDE